MKPGSIMLINAAFAFSASSPLWAKPSDQLTSASPMKQAPDPNRIVCEKIEVIGSRLATKRVCMTRAEWAEQRRHDREETEKIQNLRPCNAEIPSVTQC